MGSYDLKSVKKGMREPRIGLTQQAKVTAEIARSHLDRLEPFGISAADIETIETLRAELEGATAAQAEARDESRLSAKGEADAFGETKVFKRRLDAGVKVLYRRHDDLPVTRETFEAGGTIGRSTPKMSAYLAKVRPSVLTLAPQLTPFFGGADPVAELDRVKQALDSADAKQEASLVALPADTLAVYEKKGRLLSLIEDVNDVAASAFDGEAHLIAQFNKDVLLRARRERTRPAERAPAPTGTD